MNAPLPEHLRQALANVTLDDKYSLTSGRAFMSGVQALVRLPMLQQERDALASKKTGALISGYRGSPLGGYDQALWKAKPYLEKHNMKIFSRSAQDKPSVACDISCVSISSIIFAVFILS